MFPFDLSFQDIFIFGVVLTVAGGYKEQFLRYSRQGGVFVGRAVGFIRQKRDQVFTSTAQKQEMEALQHQLSDAMAQMQFIRHDIRSSTRFSRAYMSNQSPTNGAPGPSAGEGVAGPQITPPQGPGGGADFSVPFQPSNPLSFPDTPVTGPISSSSSNNPELIGARVESTHGSHGDAHVEGGASTGAQASVSSRPTETQYAEAAMAAVADGRSDETPRIDHVVSGALQSGTTAEPKSSLDRFNSIDVGGGSGKVVYIDGVPLIPVSAADTGKLPKRKGPVTGSDIMEEALLESQVARQAAAFLRGPPTD